MTYDDLKKQLLAGERLTGIDLTPALAAEIFPADASQRGAERHNRPIDAAHVKSLAGIIGRGEYNPSIATALLFSPPPVRLLGGHHRCLAVQHELAGGKSIQVDMAPNITNLRGDDENLASTLAHKLYKEGIATPTLVAAVVKKLAALEAGQNLKVSALRDYYFAHKNAIDEHVAKATAWLGQITVQSNRVIKPDYLAYIRGLAIRQYPVDVVDAFLPSAVRGEGPDGSLTLEAYTTLASKKTKRFTAGDVVNYLLQMLAKSVTGKRVNVLKRIKKQVKKARQQEEDRAA